MLLNVCCMAQIYEARVKDIRSKLSGKVESLLTVAELCLLDHVCWLQVFLTSMESIIHAGNYGGELSRNRPRRRFEPNVLVGNFIAILQLSDAD